MHARTVSSLTCSRGSSQFRPCSAPQLAAVITSIHSNIHIANRPAHGCYSLVTQGLQGEATARSPAKHTMEKSMSARASRTLQGWHQLEALTRGAATRTNERHSRVSGLLSASCLLRQRPTAPMDQMPLLWQSNAAFILPVLDDANPLHIYLHNLHRTEVVP